MGKELGEFNDHRVTESVQNLLDIFTGADGGVQYVLLLDALHLMEQQSEQGDEGAKEILEMVVRFNKLVQLLSGKERKKYAKKL